MPKDLNMVNMRLTPELRFQIEFISRVRGQSIKTVIERAVLDLARRAAMDGEAQVAAILGDLTDKELRLFHKWTGVWYE